MRDIPFFQTENGIASLILKEVSYKNIAYIRIQSTCNLRALIKECVDFCRAVGAEKIFATGCDECKEYPFFTSILDMSCKRETIPVYNLRLIPAEKESFEQWRSIYNERMRNVPNAATITRLDTEVHIQGAYFVYDNESLLGIGKVTDNRIDVVASVVKGVGRKIVSALVAVTKGEFVVVEVADTNLPAMRLYTDLGFTVTDKISDWYQVL